MEVNLFDYFTGLLPITDLQTTSAFMIPYPFIIVTTSCTGTVTKYCHSSGRWAGQSEGNFSNPSGWTNYYNCMLIDWEVIEVRTILSTPAKFESSSQESPADSQDV
ncbi:hypothetical protein D918_06907 [Trichuris suis]|nr:hypothetical protein D918_06907 [Trichuris suis]